MKRNNITLAYGIAALALITACQHQEDDLIIEDFEFVQGDMDDVFLALTGKELREN